MGSKTILDKNKLLQSLEVDCTCFDKTEDLVMEQMGLSNSVLTLTGIDQEKEYTLCRALAEQILGDKVPMPEEYESA